MKTEQKTDGVGIAGFVLGIVGFFGPYGIMNILGLILSAISRKEHRTTMNNAGFILNIVGLSIKLFFWFIWILIIIAAL